MKILEKLEATEMGSRKGMGRNWKIFWDEISGRITLIARNRWKGTGRGTGNFWNDLKGTEMKVEKQLKPTGIGRNRVRN